MKNAFQYELKIVALDSMVKPAVVHSGHSVSSICFLFSYDY